MDPPSVRTDGHIFISYARADGLEQAVRVEQSLGERGFHTWRDQRNLSPYQDFSSEIEIAIEQSRQVVVCLTRSVSVRSDSFVRREILYAQAHLKPITPLVFPGFPAGRLPILINHLTWIEFFDFRNGLDRLLERLTREPESVARPPVSDPFEPYLQTLYHDIVAYLDRTVLSLIRLHTDATPEAVDAPEARPRALPMSFFASSLAVNEAASGSEPPREHFDHFPAAYQRYGGRVLLLGDPGSGKTTTLMAHAREAVARRLENSDQPLPLIGRISDWPAEEPELDLWLARTLGLDRRAVAGEVEDGRALFLLDGLDELTGTGDGHRARFADTLDRLPGVARVVVTCRAEDYQELGGRLRLNGAVTLSPLDEQQVAAYLRKHPGLWAAVQRDEALRLMTRTPMLLGLLAFAYDESNAETHQLEQLSESPRELRDRIFETFVKRRYEHEKRRPQPRLSFTLEEVYDRLGYVADATLRSSVLSRAGRGVDTRIDIAEQIGATMGSEAETFLKQVHRLHFVISNGGRTRFIHALLQEHFGLKFARANAERVGPGASRLADQVLTLPRGHDIEEVWSDLELSLDDKVAIVASLVIKRLDQDIELQAQSVQALRDGAPASGSIAVETMKLKRLIDNRSQMFDMLRQIIDKYNQTAKGIIDSIGR
jgi:TIR domain/NACHT domain